MKFFVRTSELVMWIHRLRSVPKCLDCDEEALCVTTDLNVRLNLALKMAAARYRTEAQKKRRQQVAAASGPSSLHNMCEQKNRKTAIPDLIFGLFASPTAAACKNPAIRRQTRRLRPNTGFVFWPREMWRCFEDWRDVFQTNGKRDTAKAFRGFLCAFLHWSPLYNRHGYLKFWILHLRLFDRKKNWD